MVWRRGLGIERKLAKRYIEEYFARYHGVRSFMDELVKRARQDGGARTLRGRFRPLPDLTSKTSQPAAMRRADGKNTPIQGTAADILKQAMIDVQRVLGEKEPTTKMLLTVHDELVLEAPLDRKDAVCTLLKDTMEKAETLSVRSPSMSARPKPGPTANHAGWAVTAPALLDCVQHGCGTFRRCEWRRRGPLLRAPASPPIRQNHRRSVEPPNRRICRADFDQLIHRRNRHLVVIAHRRMRRRKQPSSVSPSPAASATAAV